MVKTSAVKALVSTRWRWLLGWVAVACAVLTIALGVRYHGRKYGGRLDNTVDNWVNKIFGQHNVVLQNVLHVVNISMVITAMAIAVIIGLLTERTRLVLLAIIGPIAALTITELVLKPLIGRTYNGVEAYPSGHTTITVSIIVVFGFFAAITRYMWIKIAFGVFSVLAILLVVIALIGYHYHYATDTMGGFCVATATVIGCALLIDIVADKFTRPTETTG